jgi:uncharacterized membrane-anchored protein
MVATAVRLALIMCMVTGFIAGSGSLALAQTTSPPSQSASPPVSPEEQQRAEQQAALRAALRAGVSSPGRVSLLDQGSFVVPEGSLLVPKAEATRLMRAWGNTVNETFIEHLARNPGLQAGEVSESALRALLFGI